MVLWYIRLKQAAKGKTPYSLLELEQKLQKRTLTHNSFINMINADLRNYRPYHGTDGESSEVIDDT